MFGFIKGFVLQCKWRVNTVVNEILQLFYISKLSFETNDNMQPMYDATILAAINARQRLNYGRKLDYRAAYEE